jgi:hypothetical protein
MRFLIRTKENRISGPYPKEEILARMTSGELREMDEVCSSSGYWIYLHEREESTKLLGAALPYSDEFHEESTETDTETATATQPTNAPYAANTAQDMIREARDTVNSSTYGPDEVQSPPTTNRPERIRALWMVIWIFAAILVFILLRVWQVANFPA